MLPETVIHFQRRFKVCDSGPVLKTFLTYHFLNDYHSIFQMIKHRKKKKTFKHSVDPELLNIKGHFGVFIITLKEILSGLSSQLLKMSPSMLKWS